MDAPETVVENVIAILIGNKKEPLGAMLLMVLFVNLVILLPIYQKLRKEAQVHCWKLVTQSPENPPFHQTS